MEVGLTGEEAGSQAGDERHCKSCHLCRHELNGEETLLCSSARAGWDAYRQNFGYAAGPCDVQLAYGNICGPKPGFGKKFGTNAQHHTLTLQQAALKVRAQMHEQATAMVKASLLEKQKEVVAVVVAATVPVLTDVRIREAMARMQAELQGIMRALKGLPFDDIPIGDAGLPADAKDYNISRAEYIKQVYENSMTRRDIDPAWALQEDVFEARQASCPANRVWDLH